MSQLKKPLQIQPFRQMNRLDQNAAKETWEKLSSAIDEIYNRNASILSFEEVYRCGYNLVMGKHGSMLYDGVRSSLLKHLEKSALTIYECNNENLLETIAKEWQDQTTAFNMIKDILMYMDKSFCTPQKKPTVMVLALQLFREAVINHQNIRQRMRQTLLEKISLERVGCIIDREVLKQLTSMMLALGAAGSTVYEEEFEPFFLAETEHFYQQESLDYLTRNSCAEYLQKVEQRLSEESDRLHNYIGSITEGKLRRILDQELLVRHAQTLLDMESSGLTAMLHEDRIEELKRMYTLFSRVTSCIDLMREHFGRDVVRSGLNILSSQDTGKDPVAFVRLVLDLKSKFDLIIRESFRTDKKFIKQLKDSFETFVNKDHRCASYLASYIDELLRNNSQGSTEAEIETKLDQAIVIFKHIADKDVFENYYRKLLSKRLLSNKSASDEVEKSMLVRLKAECGYQFTSKLEGMLLDMNISKTVMDTFRTSPQMRNTLVELDVQLLTTGYWPLTPSSNFRMPGQLSQSIQVFQHYYCERNSGRKLSWYANAGSVDVKVCTSLNRLIYNVLFYSTP
jgi:cullin 3